jgi:hypothetical protein
MKKPPRKTGDRSLSLRAHDLAAVRGGDGGVIHSNAIVGGGRAIVGGGISPQDDGVVHSRN